MVTFVQSWVTLTIPEILYFKGNWNTQIVHQIWICVVILAIVYFVVSFF
ncbi:hypothetical protein [Neobacillus drentensis]